MSVAIRPVLRGPRGGMLLSMGYTAEERILDNVITLDDEDGGCWPWQGDIDANGYGHIALTVNGGRWAGGVHRLAYRTWNGPIADSLDVHHICSNRCCCNPKHLVAATPRENLMFSDIAPASINARKTHCKNDHEFSSENTYVYPSGARECKACRRAKQRRKYHETES